VWGGVGCFGVEGGGERGEGRRSVERDASLQIISTIYTTFLHSYINFSCDIYMITHQFCFSGCTVRSCQIVWGENDGVASLFIAKWK